MRTGLYFALLQFGLMIVLSVFEHILFPMNVYSGESGIFVMAHVFSLIAAIIVLPFFAVWMRVLRLRSGIILIFLYFLIVLILYNLPLSANMGEIYMVSILRDARTGGAGLQEIFELLNPVFCFILACLILRKQLFRQTLLARSVENVPGP